MGSVDDLRGLLAGVDDGEVGIILREVHRVVLASFQNDVIIPGTLDPRGQVAMRKPTQEEYRGRAIKALVLVIRCRRDYKWSLRRTMETLPEALRRTLEGEEWDPGPKTAIDGAGSSRACWAPEASAAYADPMGLLRRH